MESSGIIPFILPVHTRGRVSEVIRIPPLLAVAVLLPVFVMLYWLWGLRRRRTDSVLAARTHDDTLLDINPRGQLL